MKDRLMKNSTLSGGLVSSLLAMAWLGVGCSDDGGETSLATLRETTPPGVLAVGPELAAHGWANVWSEEGRVTKGGAGADAAHVYTVTNRAELVRALYPDAVIADDGTFTSENGPDTTPKLIYVQGTISLSTNLAGEELTLEDYACEGYDFEEFKAEYDPTEWNKVLVDGDLREILPCPGTQEALRDCSRRRQRAVVQLRVGSNTSLFGLGDDAKIVHGHIIIGGPVPSGAPPQMGPAPLDPDLAEACGLPPPEPPAEPAPEPDPALALVPTAENVIVRNITFEDAFDFFPAWDPADSYSDPPEEPDPDGLYPLCQAALDAETDAGPHQCPGGRWNSSYDNITVQNAINVWIDHSTFNDGDRETQSIPSVWAAPYDLYANRVQPHDGALDINGFSDFVTVSRNVFLNHDKVMLIGGSDTVRDTNGWGALSVTVHHNQFINCGQRTPRVRFGKVHVYSNYIEGSRPPQIATQEDRASKPMPEYPMGSALTVGHLAKVYSEDNAYVIAAYPGDDEPTAAHVAQPAHRATPTEGDTPDVNQQTYFFDSGSELNGDEVDLMASVQEQAVDDEDPEVLSTEDIWKPEDTYAYRTTAAGNVRRAVASSGAGKISVSFPE
jgi:pectate lyase